MRIYTNYKKPNTLLEAEDEKSNLDQLYKKLNNFVTLDAIINYSEKVFNNILNIDTTNFQALANNVIKTHETFDQSATLLPRTWQKWIKNLHAFYIAQYNLFDAISKNKTIADKFKKLDEIRQAIKEQLSLLDLNTIQKFDQLDQEKIAQLAIKIEQLINTENNYSILEILGNSDYHDIVEQFIKQHDKVNDLANWFKDSWKNFKNGFDNLTVDEKIFEQLQKVILELERRQVSLTNINIKANSCYNINFLKNIINSLKKINELLAQLLQLLTSIQEVQLQKTNKWEEIFREAARAEVNGAKKAIQQAWTQYYAQEWPDFDRATLAEIGNAFTAEINTYGFSALHNPFISYLKRMQQKPDFMNLLKENSSAYIQIHNAVSRDTLSELALRGKGFVELNNIIFSTDFYKQSIDDIPKYLAAQKKVINIISNSKFSGFAHEFLNREYDIAKNKSSVQQFFVDLFYENGNLYLGPTAERTQGDINNKLQGIERIQNAINLCFTQEQLGEHDSETLEDTTKPVIRQDFDTVFRKFDRQILKTATTTEVVSYAESLKDFYKKLRLNLNDPFKQNASKLPEARSHVDIQDALIQIGYHLPALNELKNDEEALTNILNLFLDRLYKDFEKKDKERRR